MPLHKSILEAINELVYVADIDTYELLYVNNAMLKAFRMHRSNVIGRKCYEVIMGFDRPCEFCTNAKLCPSKFYTWTTHNRLLNRVYKVSDSLIEFNGRLARIEIASDISDFIDLHEARRDERDINKIYRNLINLLNCRHIRFTTILNTVLAQLLKLMHGKRIGVYSYTEEDTQTTSCAQQTAKGTVEIVNFALRQNMDFVRTWEKRFKGRRDILVQDPQQAAAGFPNSAAFYRENGITSFYCHPLFFEGRRQGLLIIDNPDALALAKHREKLHNIAALLAGSLYRQKHQTSLEHILYHDARTGLYNRACFMKDLEQSCERRANLGIIIVDINGLKAINDDAGHAQGDDILKKTASVLTQLYGLEQCYCLGDDEFAVTFSNISARMFDEARFTIRSTFAGGLGFSASVGGALGNANDYQQLITNASTQMLVQKQHFYHTHPLRPRYRPSSDQILQRLSQPHTIKTLLQHGAFTAYIQPIFDTQGHLAKGEALVRLNYHNTFISPVRFIPLLEAMNMTGEIDFYMFKKTCELIKSRLTQGLNIVPLATNFSRFTVTAPDFVKKLEEIVKQTCIDPGLVYIEVTESIEEREHQTLVDVTHALTDKGFKVAVDDYGVGSANLLTFANLAMTTIKFDKKIIDALTVGNNAYTTVKSFLTLVHQRGIKAVAEGVERREQVQMLKDLGFDYLQGFYFSKPLPLHDFITLCDAPPAPLTDC